MTPGKADALEWKDDTLFPGRNSVQPFQLKQQHTRQLVRPWSSHKMSLISICKPLPTATRTLIYEIPNFVDEAKLLAVKKEENCIRSRPYSFKELNVNFTGSITITARGENLEFCHDIRLSPYSQIYHASKDVKCIMNITLESMDFRLACCSDVTSYGAVGPQCPPHKTVASLPFAAMNTVVPDHLKNKVKLHVMCTLTIFGGRSNSEWQETVEAPKVLVSAPILQPVRDRKFSDLTVECAGREFPAHHLVLKCTSPVFAAMLETAMREATSGRIKIEDVGSQAAERLLEFIYTGTLHLEKEEKVIPDDLVVELVHCADKYAIPEMKQQALLQLQFQLNISNAVKFAKAVQLYGGGDPAVSKVLEFCKKNLLELPEGPELQDFIVNNVKHFF